MIDYLLSLKLVIVPIFFL